MNVFISLDLYDVGIPERLEQLKPIIFYNTRDPPCRWHFLHDEKLLDCDALKEI